MQFIDLGTQQQRIYRGLLQRIEGVFSHGRYIMGPEIRELEEELADFCGVKYAIGCSSGTDALLMSLMSIGVKAKDLIFTTPFTFIATAEVIALMGAIPIFVDIHPKTFNLDAEKLELAVQAAKERRSSVYPLPKAIEQVDEKDLTAKGIIAVDLFGLPADYDQINKVAKENQLFVIGDAAQSFGASYKGRMVGTLCDITTTSFFPAKPLGCYGDGGAIFTNDENLALELRSIRVHGKGTDKYDNVRLGINGRLDTIQAAILLEKLKIFPDEVRARNWVATQYTSALQDYLTTPHVPSGLKSVWAQYSILCDQRNALQSYLEEADIPTAIYYPKPLHLQKVFSYLGYSAGDFPIAEKISSRILSVPMHPYLSSEQIKRVTERIISFYTNMDT